MPQDRRIGKKRVNIYAGEKDIRIPMVNKDVQGQFRSKYQNTYNELRDRLTSVKYVCKNSFNTDCSDKPVFSHGNTGKNLLSYTLMNITFLVSQVVNLINHHTDKSQF